MWILSPSVNNLWFKIKSQHSLFTPLRQLKINCTVKFQLSSWHAYAICHAISASSLPQNKKMRSTIHIIIIIIIIIICDAGYELRSSDKSASSLCSSLYRNFSYEARLTHLGLDSLHCRRTVLNLIYLCVIKLSIITLALSLTLSLLFLQPL